jgi:hypothetical protein
MCMVVYHAKILVRGLPSREGFRVTCPVCLLPSCYKIQVRTASCGRALADFNSNLQLAISEFLGRADMTRMQLL